MKSIKQWILNRGFIKEAIKQAKIQAFTDSQKDFKETVRNDDDERAKLIAENMLTNMLSVVDFKKIVTLDKAHGIVFIGGEKADEGRLANLKAEAEFFENSDLWHIIHETTKELAHKTMFVSSESLVDLQKGKSILFALSAQKNILDTFISYQKKK